MYQKRILTGILFTVLGFTLFFNQASGQWTDYNQHDPGITSASIPSWIKNTASWWAMDLISEKEFLRAIEYLIDNDIMTVNAIPTTDIPDITATHTLPPSRQTEFVQVAGSFDIKHIGPLTLFITQPDQTQFTLTTISRDGTFTATMELNSESQIGTYLVYAEIEGDLHLVQAFEVKDQNASKVPSWIKNNAQWWAENKITDSDFIKGIEFLVSNKIIAVATPEKSIPIGPGLTQDKCSGTARCFSGQVTQVVDGDTIRVNEHSIRFTLVSAPELKDIGGYEAQDFMDDICPVGSEALVDEDDGQTQGSHGRIVAVIYCNGLNLNEELLEANLGHLEFEFCKESEFAATEWAINHGCKENNSQLSIEVKEPDCDPSYPDVCIPPPPPDLDCGDIEYRDFEVLQPDPHRFDGNYDGIGCES